MSDERIEYGVQLVWPDGTYQIDVCDSFLADARIEWHNNPANNSVCSAHRVRRTVTTSNWEPAE